MVNISSILDKDIEESYSISLLDTIKKNIVKTQIYNKIYRKYLKYVKKVKLFEPNL
jgi:hypothetical protein